MDSKSIDMLHGPLLGKIPRYAIPFALSSILEQLFITIDVAVVGRFASSEALAAVGANTFLINLFINLFVGISLGANVVLANFIGQNDPQRIRRAVSTTAALALISGFFLLIVGSLVAKPMLTPMGTPSNVLDGATLFLRIYFLGSPCFMIYNFGASVLVEQGRYEAAAEYSYCLGHHQYGSESYLCDRSPHERGGRSNSYRPCLRLQCFCRGALSSP